MEDIWADILKFFRTVGWDLLLSIIVLCVGFKLIRVLSKSITRSRVLEKVDPSVASFIRNFVMLVLRIAVVVTACIILGIPATSFVTILASAGVTVGLALQGSLSNFAGGLMIMFFRPYGVGDTIRALNLEGVVKEISVFYTILVTSDNSRVILPNGSLTNSSIINYSAERIRRVQVTLALPVRGDASELKTRIASAVYAREDLLKEPSAEVVLTARTAQTYEFTVRAWCDADDYDDVTLVIKGELASALEA